jgi:intraflagellar transport protein 88
MSKMNNIREIGLVQDAIHAFESVMENKIDHQTAYNLTVCYYVLGNREQMKNCFTKMLLVKYYDSDSDDENEEENSILRVCSCT